MQGRQLLIDQALSQYQVALSAATPALQAAFDAYYVPIIKTAFEEVISHYHSDIVLFGRKCVYENSQINDKATVLKKFQTRLALLNTLTASDKIGLTVDLSAYLTELDSIKDFTSPNLIKDQENLYAVLREHDEPEQAATEAIIKAVLDAKDVTAERLNQLIAFCAHPTVIGGIRMVYTLGDLATKYVPNQKKKTSLIESAFNSLVDGKLTRKALSDSCNYIISQAINDYALTHLSNLPEYNRLAQARKTPSYTLAAANTLLEKLSDAENRVIAAQQLIGFEDAVWLFMPETEKAKVRAAIDQAVKTEIAKISPSAFLPRGYNPASATVITPSASAMAAGSSSASACGAGSETHQSIAAPDDSLKDQKSPHTGAGIAASPLTNAASSMVFASARHPVATAPPDESCNQGEVSSGPYNPFDVAGANPFDQFS